MEDFIAGLVSQLDSGTIDLRQFCETAALAAIVYAAGEDAANAAPAQGFRPIAINHISYACGDYRSAGAPAYCQKRKQFTRRFAANKCSKKPLDQVQG